MRRRASSSGWYCIGAERSDTHRIVLTSAHQFGLLLRCLTTARPNVEPDDEFPRQGQVIVFLPPKDVGPLIADLGIEAAVVGPCHEVVAGDGQFGPQRFIARVCICR